MARRARQISYAGLDDSDDDNFDVPQEAPKSRLKRKAVREDEVEVIPDSSDEGMADEGEGEQVTPGRSRGEEEGTPGRSAGEDTPGRSDADAEPSPPPARARTPMRGHKADEESDFDPDADDGRCSDSDFSDPDEPAPPPPPAPKPKGKGKVAKKAAAAVPKAKAKAPARRGAVAKPAAPKARRPLTKAGAGSSSRGPGLKPVVRQMVIPKVGRRTIVDGKLPRLLKSYKR